MTEKVETLHAAGFIISEANGTRSRANIVLASGENRGAGTVLGALVTAGTATGAAKAGNVGNDTIGTISVGGGAKEGDYTITIIEPATNLGVFEVQDPEGNVVGRGNVGTAFAGDVNFTITDGATDAASRRPVHRHRVAAHAQVHDPRAGGDRRHAARGGHPARRRRTRPRPTRSRCAVVARRAR
jgi:hypothetical protein